jgi:hypothetical protein
MDEPVREEFLRSARARFAELKALGERALDRMDEADLRFTPDPESNSVAVIVQHVAGNMMSRWTDFLTTDGEKPDRNRDQEFEEREMSRDELVAEWEDGWRRVFEALDGITDADLQQTVYIRSEPHSIYKAISRQVAHYAGHAYQILLLAKHFKGREWKTLSIPRGQSEEFNRRMLAKLKAAQQ